MVSRVKGKARSEKSENIISMFRGGSSYSEISEALGLPRKRVVDRVGYYRETGVIPPATYRSSEDLLRKSFRVGAIRKDIECLSKDEVLHLAKYAKNGLGPALVALLRRDMGIKGE